MSEFLLVCVITRTRQSHLFFRNHTYTLWTLSDFVWRRFVLDHWFICFIVPWSWHFYFLSGATPASHCVLWELPHLAYIWTTSSCRRIVVAWSRRHSCFSWYQLLSGRGPYFIGDDFVLHSTMIGFIITRSWNFIPYFVLRSTPNREWLSLFSEFILLLILSRSRFSNYLLRYNIYSWRRRHFKGLSCLIFGKIHLRVIVTRSRFTVILHILALATHSVSHSFPNGCLMFVVARSRQFSCWFWN